MLNYPFLATRDRFLEGIRNEPRFGELMEQVRARDAMEHARGISRI
jgi:hypothetical protein